MNKEIKFEMVWKSLLWSSKRRLDIETVEHYIDIEEYSDYNQCVEYLREKANSVGYNLKTGKEYLSLEKDIS